MQPHGFRGTVPTITQLADTGVLTGLDHLPCLRWEHCRTLMDAGWCITPHSVTHAVDASAASATAEMGQSKNALLAALGSGSGAEYFTYPGAWMMGPAWSQFPALEAEARRLFRSARLWHQPGFLDADGVEQTEITSVADVPVVTRDTDPYRVK